APNVKIDGGRGLLSYVLLHGCHGDHASGAGVNGNEFEGGVCENVLLTAMTLAGPEIEPVAAGQKDAAGGCALTQNGGDQQIGTEHELIVGRYGGRVVLVMPKQWAHDWCA